MVLLSHELRRGRLALIIWAAVLSFTLAVSILILPMLEAEIAEMEAMLESMGPFMEALGMENVNFAEFTSYFGSECGETLGLGGAIFAALLGISLLSKEEKEHTAEFLLSHPISRARIVTEKLLSAVVRILLLNLAVFLVSLVSILAIGADADFKAISLLFLAFALLQTEILSISVGISAFLRRSGVGIGIGVTFLLYALNLLSNLAEDVEFLRYLTPFGFASGAEILDTGSIPAIPLAVGAVVTALSVAAAYFGYTRKDIS